MIDQARTSLLCLDALLQKAKLLDRADSVGSRAESEGIQQHFENLIKLVEMLPENLKLEERLMRKDEMEVLLRQMEGLRKKLEVSLGKIESTVEANLNNLNEAIEALNLKITPHPDERVTQSSLAESQRLLEQGKQQFEAHDFEASIRAFQDVLRRDPANPEVRSLLDEAQRKWEERRLEEELVVHIDNLKKEAMDHFEKEHYEECMGMFRFLCELEPQNRTLRDYLELSQQKAQEMTDSKARSQPLIVPPSRNDKSSI